MAPKAVFLAVVAERTEGRRNCCLKREEEERREAANTMLKDLDVVDYLKVCSYENCERNVSTVIRRSGGGVVRLYSDYERWE